MLEEIDGPEVTYRLSHPLLQEVAYAELPEMRRRRVHARMAATLERLRPDDLERLACHYRGAGPEVEQDRALAVLLAAGERAQEIYANDVAAQHFGAALALLRAGHSPAGEAEPSVPLLPSLLERLGDSWERVGEGGAAVAVWTEALKEYERLRDARSVARLCRLLALAEWDRGHFDIARAHLSAGLASHAGSAPSDELVELHFARGLILSRVGNAEAIMAATEELRVLAETLASPRAEAVADLMESGACMARGDGAGARSYAVRALPAAAAAGDPLLAQGAHDRLMRIALLFGQPGLIRHHAEQSLALARRLGAPTLELVPRHRLVMAEFFAGDWEGALRCADESIALSRRVGHPRSLAYLLGMRAMVLARRGDLDGAQACVAEARAAFGAGSPADRHVFGVVEFVEILVALERGQSARAHQIARGFARGASGSAGLSSVDLPLGLALLAEAQVAVGEAESALATARGLAALDPVSPPASGLSARGTGYPGALAARVEGLARRALSQPESALSCLAHAAEAFATFDMPFDLACARLEWATVAAPAQRGAGAAAAQESLALFERLGARRHAQRARQVLQGLGVRPQGVRRPRPSAGILSARELEVARLVADGLTAAEIADRLAISQHTATTHLHRIYTRLGIGSRAALARYVVESGLLGEED